MMSPDELDEVYTRTCTVMTELGEARTEVFLARLALLLMKDIGDVARIEAAILAARSGLK